MNEDPDKKNEQQLGDQDKNPQKLGDQDKHPPEDTGKQPKNRVGKNKIDNKDKEKKSPTEKTEGGGEESDASDASPHGEKGGRRKRRAATKNIKYAVDDDEEEENDDDPPYIDDGKDDDKDLDNLSEDGKDKEEVDRHKSNSPMMSPTTLRTSCKRCLTSKKKCPGKGKVPCESCELWAQSVRVNCEEKNRPRNKGPCARCLKLKLVCDEKFPCGNCVAESNKRMQDPELCVYEPMKKRGRKKNSVTPNKPRMLELNEGLKDLKVVSQQMSNDMTKASNNMTGAIQQMAYAIGDMSVQVTKGLNGVVASNEKIAALITSGEDKKRKNDDPIGESEQEKKRAKK